MFIHSHREGVSFPPTCVDGQDEEDEDAATAAPYGAEMTSVVLKESGKCSFRQETTIPNSERILKNAGPRHDSCLLRRMVFVSAYSCDCRPAFLKIKKK